MAESPPTHPKGLGLGVTLPSDAAKPARTITPTQQRANPISLRLWKIISTSANGGFDDPASKEALEIISERYCGAGITRNSEAKRGRRKKGNVAGAHWLGEDAVRRAGLAIGDREQGEEVEEYYLSSSEEEEEEEDEGSDTSRETPASSIRPGILSRNQSSSTSIRSAHAASSSSAAAAPGAGQPSLITGATNAKRYFKRDLEAGLVSGSLRFLKAFEKVDEVSPRLPQNLPSLGAE